LASAQRPIVTVYWCPINHQVVNYSWEREIKTITKKLITYTLITINMVLGKDRI